MKSPLQLESCRLLSISVEAVSGFAKRDNISATAQVGLAQSNENPRQWRIEITVSLGDGSPYTGHATVVGVYRVDDAVPESDVSKLVAVNGSSILYGTVREYFAGLTARSTNGELLLPSMSFADLDPKRQPDGEGPVVE